MASFISESRHHQGESLLRQAEVQSLFLERFGALYPRLTFRGVRSFPDRTCGPYAFILRAAFGRAGLELEMLCVALGEAFPKKLERFTRRVQEAKLAQSGADLIPVLVAPYLSEEARGLCRQAGIGYFDLAGNASLDSSQVFFEVSGKPNPHVRQRQVRTPFEGKAERVVRTLLLRPSRHWNMRDLARSSHVSLGLTSMTTTALADMEVVTKGRSGLELLAPAALLEAWSQSYDLQRSLFRVYRSWAQVPELERRLADQRKSLGGRWALTLWSGAHHLLSLEETPPRLAVYWSGKLEGLAQALGLSEHGGRTLIFVFRPYDESLLWGARKTGRRLTSVHPLQLYLDLCSGDAEELGLAGRVRSALLPW